MSANEQQLQSQYATRAPEYDSIYLKPERQADLRLMEKWLAPMFVNSRVLEVACGRGAFAGLIVIVIVIVAISYPKWGVFSAFREKVR